MSVPFLDVAAATAELRGEIDAAVARVLDRGWYVLGDEVEAFEREWAAYVGARHCVSVGNGLDALHLALRAVGAGPGGEVHVPSHTFVATWLAATYAGAVPVPVEPDETWTMGAVPDDARFVVPVHLYGLAAEPQVPDGARVVVDAAQAHGAVVGPCDAAAWSFYPAKNLGALGDGGAVTTDDDDVAAKVRRLRNYGSERKYVHDVAGYNTRLDEVQAAVLRVKLPYLAEWNARRAAVAAAYLEGLQGLPLGLPVVPEGRSHVWHLFVVTTPRRDALAEHLKAEGIGTGVHYPVPCHRQRAYASYAGYDLPVADLLAREVLSLPIGPHLPTGDVERVVESVRAFFEEGG